MSRGAGHVPGHPAGIEALVNQLTVDLMQLRLPRADELERHVFGVGLNLLGRAPAINQVAQIRRLISLQFTDFLETTLVHLLGGTRTQQIAAGADEHVPVGALDRGDLCIGRVFGKLDLLDITTGGSQLVLCVLDELIDTQRRLQILSGAMHRVPQVGLGGLDLSEASRQGAVGRVAPEHQLRARARTVLAGHRVVVDDEHRVAPTEIAVRYLDRGLAAASLGVSGGDLPGQEAGGVLALDGPTLGEVQQLNGLLRGGGVNRHPTAHPVVGRVADLSAVVVDARSGVFLVTGVGEPDLHAGSGHLGLDLSGLAVSKHIVGQTL